MTEIIKKILSELSIEEIEKLKMLSQIFSGSEQYQPTLIKISVEQGLDEYEKLAEFNQEPKTISLLKTANRKFKKFIPSNRLINTITNKDVEYLFRENSKTAPRGAYNYHRIYHAEFNQFIKLDYLNSNPFDIKLPKLQEEEPIVISNEEINIILNKLIELNKALIADMVLFAVNSGLRLSEETNLRWTDIDLKNKVMTIGNKNFKTKTKRTRKIPLNLKMGKILKKNSDIQLNKSGTLKEFVFTQENGRPFKSDTVSKTFKRALRAAGLSESYHWHCLRSTVTSNWVNRKVPIYTAQKLLGHAQTSTTARYYAKVNLDELRDAVNRV